MEELDAYINQVKKLPPAPRTLAKLLMLLGDPDIDASQVVSLITHEPALTANVLQRCNAAYFATGEPVGNIGEAVTRLGFNHIFRMVAVVVGAQAFGGSQKSYGFEYGELWRHSVAAALAAQKMAESKGDDGNMAFTGGLLHDIGKNVLAEALEDHYRALIEQTEASQQSLLEVEKSILRVQHAEVGGRMLARWNLPENLIEAIRASGAKDLTVISNNCGIDDFGLGILLVSFIAGAIETHSGRKLVIFGWGLSLEGAALVAMYLIGILGEVLLLTSFYLVMPVVRITFRHALLGGTIATVFWEITRHVLAWYYSVLSSVNLIYGSFATSVVALISIEAIAVIILLGAQVIAELERGNPLGRHSEGIIREDLRVSKS